MTRHPRRIVIVDHYDSYTWNLAHLIGAVTGVLPTVVEHDVATMTDLAAYSHIVLSPGPGHPDDENDFALGRRVLADPTRPVLGVCLGMQGIVTAFGGSVTQAAPAHGVVSVIHHDGSAPFGDLPPFRAVRYHSLVASRLTDEVRATAHTEDGTVMAVAHRTRPVVGVQFHPESVLSEFGRTLVENFLDLA